MRASALNHPLRSCPICGGTERETLYEQRFAEFSEEGLLAGYDVVVCRHCGFCFGDHIPDQAAFDRYYQVMSKYEFGQRAPNPRDPDRLRFEAMAPIVEKAARRKDERILEIGCASGQLLNVLQKRGYSKLRGIDPSPVCGRTARECYGIQVDSETFSGLKLTEPAADLVILIGVLEHLCDLEQAMAVLKSLVPVSGRLFITVPDASRYAAGEDAPFQEFSVEHINFFGPASLDNLMAAHGFGRVFCEQGMIQANVRTVTPVLHAAFERHASAPTMATARPLPEVDRETERGLRNYIAKSNLENQAVAVVLEKLACSGRPLAVWGAGAHTARLLAGSTLAQANVLGIIDSNPRYRGKKLGRWPIVGPSQAPSGQTAVLVSSRVYQEDICLQIRNRLGWTNEIITLY